MFGTVAVALVRFDMARLRTCSYFLARFWGWPKAGAPGKRQLLTRTREALWAVCSWFRVYAECAPQGVQFL